MLRSHFLFTYLVVCCLFFGIQTQDALASGTYGAVQGQGPLVIHWTVTVDSQCTGSFPTDAQHPSRYPQDAGDGINTFWTTQSHPAGTELTQSFSTGALAPAGLYRFLCTSLSGASDFTDLAVVAPPTNVSASCSNGIITINATTWPVLNAAGPTTYPVRVDDLGDAWQPGACTGFTGNDYCINTPTSFPVTVTETIGHTYRVWVHTKFTGTNGVDAWSNLYTVTPDISCTPITGTVTSYPPCTVAAGGNSCTSSVTWNSNATSPSLLLGATQIYTSQSGSNQSVTLFHGANTYTLKDGASVLDTKSVTADCTGGSTWDGSTCVANPCSSLPTQTWLTNCSATVPGVLSSHQSMVNNAANNGYTGSATWTCTSGVFSGPTNTSCTAIAVSGSVSPGPTVNQGQNATLTWSTTGNECAVYNGTSGIVMYGTTSNMLSQVLTGYPGDLPLLPGPYLYRVSCDDSANAARGTWVAPVTVTVVAFPHTITASAGPNGTVVPTTPGSCVSSPCTVSYSGTQAFSITPSSGYAISGLVVDTQPATAASTFTFSNVITDHSIAATFASTACTLPWGGTLPSGQFTTAYNLSGATSPTTLCASETRTCTNGSLSGSYINQTCVQSYTISASAGANGSITPSGAVVVSSGNPKSFTMTPSAGYQVSSVTVDGSSVGAPTTYTFNSVTANHTIVAAFSLAPCGNGATNPPTCSVCPTNNAMVSGICTPVTVSVSASTPYSVVVNTPINFTFTPNTNSGTTDCRLLDYLKNPLPGSNYTTNITSITYPAPSITGAYSYYVGCRNTTFNSITGTSSVINVTVTAAPVNGACASPLVPYGCSAGASINNATNASGYTWTCQGINGGSNIACSEPYTCGIQSSATPRLVEPTTNPAACNPGTYTNTPADTTTAGSQAWNWSCGGVPVCSAPKFGCTTTTDTNFTLPQYGASGPNNNWGCASTCANGAGDYPTCTPPTCAAPAGWTGGPIANGASVPAYNAPSATAPDICANHLQTRTCNNGTLSGTYPYQGCVQFGCAQNTTSTGLSVTLSTTTYIAAGPSGVFKNTNAASNSGGTYCFGNSGSTMYFVPINTATEFQSFWSAVTGATLSGLYKIN